MTPPKCANNIRFNDFGIFTGLASVPFGKDTDFFTKVVKKLFSRHKKAVERNFIDCTDDERKVYNDEFFSPRAYATFGDFDMLLLAKVDSSEFAIRTFQPYDPLSGSDSKPGFSYRVLQGLVPTCNGVNSSLNKNFDFLSEKPLPFCSVTQLKINTSFLIPLGFDNLSFVISGLNKVLESFQPDKGIELKYNILVSQSWNELSLILYSNSLNSVMKLAATIRELSLGELCDGLENCSGVLNDSNSNVLSKVIQKANKKDKANYHIRASHVFENSRTILGCELDVWMLAEEGDQDKLRSIVFEEDIYYYTEWKSKGGHILSAIKSLDANVDEVLVCPGRSDIIYPIQLKKRTVSDWILHHSELLGEKLSNDIDKHILSCNTIFGLSPDKLFLEEVKHEHFYLRNIVLKFPSLKQREINDLHKSLKKAQVSTILTSRILNIIGNFNLSVSDPILAGSMLEISPFIKYLFENHQELYKEIIKEPVYYEKVLQKNIDLLERGWRNRFSSNLKLQEFYDFNIDFKTGIQQNLTAIDGAYKIILKAVTGNISAFAVVGAEPDVKATEQAVMMNFLHLFQPAFFAAFAGHEAGHYLLKSSGIKSELWKYTTFNKMSKQFITDLMDRSKLLDSQPGLRHFLTPAFFDDLVADTVAYYFTFVRNSKLFIFWYLGHFFTSRNSINNIKEDGIIQRKNYSVVNILLRLILILKIHDPGINTKEALKGWFDEGLINFIEAIATRIRNQGEFGIWMMQIRNTVQDRFVDAFSDQDNKAKDNEKERIEEVISKLSESAIKFKKMFREGYVPKFEKYCNDSSYVILSLYSYLDLIKELSGPGQHILRRNVNGEPIIKKNCAKIMFDPRGGLFSIDPSVRRNLFRYRSVISICLWNASMHLKKEMYESLYGLND